MEVIVEILRLIVPLYLLTNKNRVERNIRDHVDSTPPEIAGATMEVGVEILCLIFPLYHLTNKNGVKRNI